MGLIFVIRKEFTQIITSWYTYLTLMDGLFQLCEMEIERALEKKKNIAQIRRAVRT